MPFTIKQGLMKYRDENGEYHAINTVAEKTTAEMVAEIEQVGEDTVDSVQDQVDDIVADAQEAVNTLESQKNTIAQTVASMAELGTDDTLSTPGMAADAAATGSLKSALSQNNMCYALMWHVGYVHKNGTVTPMTTSDHRYSDLYPVEAGERYHFVSYDSNSVLTLAMFENTTDGAVTSVSYKGTGAKQELDVVIPTGIKYIRITYNTLNITFPELYKRTSLTDVNAAINTISGDVNKIDDAITDQNVVGTPVTISSVSEGYVNLSGGIGSSGAYRYTNLISVTPGDKYIIETSTSENVLAVAFYETDESSTADTTKSIIGITGKTKYNVIIPTGVGYMRISCQNSVVDLIYKSHLYSAIEQNTEDIQEIKKKIPDNLLLKKRRASVSFIFDDGGTADADVKAIFDTKGKKCGFAIYADSPNIGNCKSYYDEGFEILAHSNSSIGPTTGETKIRQYMEAALATVLSITGECHGWVTPNSVIVEARQWITYDYFEYGYTVYKGDVATPSEACMNKNLHSYSLWRSSIESLTLVELEAILDYAKANNLLVCIYGHSRNMDATGNNFTSQGLSDLLDYCDTIGMEVLTPYESTIKYFSYRHNEDGVTESN